MATAYAAHKTAGELGLAVGSQHVMCENYYSHAGFQKGDIVTLIRDDNAAPRFSNAEGQEQGMYLRRCGPISPTKHKYKVGDYVRLVFTERDADFYGIPSGTIVKLDHVGSHDVRFNGKGYGGTFSTSFVGFTQIEPSAPPAFKKNDRVRITGKRITGTGGGTAGPGIGTIAYTDADTPHAGLFSAPEGVTGRGYYGLYRPGTYEHALDEEDPPMVAELSSAVLPNTIKQLKENTTMASTPFYKVIKETPELAEGAILKLYDGTTYLPISDLWNQEGIEESIRVTNPASKKAYYTRVWESKDTDGRTVYVDRDTARALLNASVSLVAKAAK